MSAVREKTLNEFSKDKNELDKSIQELITEFESKYGHRFHFCYLNITTVDEVTGIRITNNVKTVFETQQPN